MVWAAVHGESIGWIATGKNLFDFRMDDGTDFIARILFRKCLPVVLKYFTDGNCYTHTCIVKDKAGLCKEKVQIGTKSLDLHERGVAAFFIM